MSNGNKSDIKLDGDKVIVDGVLKLDSIEGKTDEYVKISEARLKRATVGVLTGDSGNARDELVCKARKFMLFNPQVTEENKKTGIALSHLPETDTLVINEGDGYSGVHIEGGARGVKISGTAEFSGQLILVDQNTKLDLGALVLQLQKEIEDLKKKLGN